MYWKFSMMLLQHPINSDWLFSTQSRVLQGDWLMLENNEKATLTCSICNVSLYGFVCSTALPGGNCKRQQPLLLKMFMEIVHQRNRFGMRSAYIGHI